MGKLDAAIKLLEGAATGILMCGKRPLDERKEQADEMMTAKFILEAAAKMPGPEARLFWAIVQKDRNIEWPEMDALLAALPDEEAK